MKGKLLIPNETLWRPSSKQINARESLLYKLGFEKYPTKKEWHFKKAAVTYELITVAHDQTFVEILQYALMQNFIDPIRSYMVNSDETV